MLRRNYVQRKMHFLNINIQTKKNVRIPHTTSSRARLLVEISIYKQDLLVSFLISIKLYHVYIIYKHNNASKHLQCIGFVVVRLDGDLLARQYLFEHTQHHRFVECIRMIEIEQTFFGLQLFGGCQLAIETILADADHLAKLYEHKRI